METVVVYAQSHSSSGRLVPLSVLERHYGDAWGDSADLLVLRGSRAELLDLAATYEARREADGGFAARVADSIRTQLDETEEEIVSRLVGERLDSPLVRRALDRAQWNQLWPVIDRDLCLTGEVTDASAGFLNYEDEAFIRVEEARAGGWVDAIDEGYAKPGT